MPTEDLNIESKLKFSKRLVGIAKGHQLEMQQVLEDNEDLQMLLAGEYKRRLAVEAENTELKKQIAQLQAEIQELHSRPNIVTDTYIETQNVKQQCNYLPHSRRTSRYKLNNTTQTQLQLWNTPTATSI